MIRSALSVVRGLVKLAGSAGTVIGNEQDRLKVSDVLTSKLRIEPTTSAITIVAGGSFTNVYSYTGSGYLLGFSYEFNNTGILVKIQIDGESVLAGTMDIATFNSLLATSNNTARYQNGTGVVTTGSMMDFSLGRPIRFATSAVISAAVPGATNRSFLQGVTFIQKDT